MPATALTDSTRQLPAVTHPRFGATDMLLLFTATAWGVNYTSVKIGATAMSPLVFTGLRVLAAAVVLVTAAILEGKPRPTRRDAWRLVGLGVIGNGLYQLCFVGGVARTRVADAALIFASAPVVIATISHWGGVERVDRKTIAGIMLSIIGVGLVIFGGTMSNSGSNTALGTILVCAGVVLWSGYTVALQPYTHRVTPLQLSALTMIGGVLPLLITTPRALMAVHWGALGFTAWAALFYSSVISMAIAYMFWYRGIRVLGPTRTSVYGNLQPVIAILVAWLLLHEAPTAWQGAGTATILGGLFLARA